MISGFLEVFIIESPPSMSIAAVAMAVAGQIAFTPGVKNEGNYGSTWNAMDNWDPIVDIITRKYLDDASPLRLPAQPNEASEASSPPGKYPVE